MLHDICWSWTRSFHGASPASQGSKLGLRRALGAARSKRRGLLTGERFASGPRCLIGSSCALRTAPSRHGGFMRPRRRGPSALTRPAPAPPAAAKALWRPGAPRPRGWGREAKPGGGRGWPRVLRPPRRRTSASAAYAGVERAGARAGLGGALRWSCRPRPGAGFPGEAAFGGLLLGLVLLKSQKFPEINEPLSTVSSLLFVRMLFAWERGTNPWANIDQFFTIRSNSHVGWKR